MKKKLMTVLAIVLVVALSVAGTYAYLTSQDTVTNTFTVGNIAITLDEAKVDEYGVVDASAARVDANTYKLIPGHSYTKDPTVHFAAGSEASYLFVEVVDQISAIEADTTVAAQIAANGWTKLEGVDNVYYKSVSANTGDEAVNYPVFGSFKLTDNAAVASYAGKTITVTAYAVQADGFDTASAAWAVAATLK